MKLPSGTDLEITLSPFEVSNDLMKALMVEIKALKMSAQDEVDVDFFKNAICSLMSSPVVEKCMWKCMEKCTYNGLRLSKESFEPEEARQDYPVVCWEVAKANVGPFMKGLSARYSHLLESVKSSLALRPQTTSS